MIVYREADALKYAVSVAKEVKEAAPRDVPVYLCHQTNCMGVMGSGIALQIRKTYPEVYASYKDYCAQKGHWPDMLGSVQYVPCDDGVTVANLFGQYGYGRHKQQTNYEALEKAFTDIRDKGYSIVVIPYMIGCGLGGGDWAIVEKMISDVFSGSQCEVCICKLPE